MSAGVTGLGARYPYCLFHLSLSVTDFAFVILLPSFFYNLLCLRLFPFILGSTQPSIQSVLRWSSPGYSRRVVKPTTRLDIEPKLKMCRAVPPLTHTSLWHIQVQLYILRCFFSFSVMFFPYFHSRHFHFPAVSLSYLLTHYVSTNLTHHLHCLPCGLSRLLPYLLLLRATHRRGQTHYL